MSLLIKGMKMPERCEDCLMYRHNAEYDYAYCCISSVNVLGHGNARLNNCPLVEVPFPHGHLIDADELMLEFAEFVRASNNSDFADVPRWNDAVSLLGSAPTIIEAEEGEA